MPTLSNRFPDAIARFDAANREDPNRAKFDGQPYPAELLYGMRMTEWLGRLTPDSSEALQLAVRCQHIRRWEIPRAQYPMTRPGYLRWRSDLARFHADVAGEILRSVGYDEPMIARVQSLVRKEGLKSDPETQALEDAACLVFLENDYVEFARGHDEEKVIHILKRTWRKMSERGRAAAVVLAGSLPERERGMIERAIAAG